MSGGGGLRVPGGAQRPRPRSLPCLFTWRLGDVTGRAAGAASGPAMCLKLQAPFTYFAF